MKIRKIALIGCGPSSGGLVAVLSDVLSYSPPNNLIVKLFSPDQFIKENCHISDKIEYVDVSDGNAISKRKAEVLIKQKVKDFSPDAVFFVAGKYYKGMEEYKSFIILNNQLYVDFPKILQQKNLKLSISLLRAGYIFRKNLSHIDYLIYSSQYSYEIGNRVLKKNNCIVIPFACNSCFLAKNDQINRRFNDKEIKLLLIGSVIPYKNQLNVIKGVEILLSNGYNVTLTIVGSVLSKRYYRECIKYIKINGLEKYIHFIKWIVFKDIPKFIEEFDIYINSSETDTCGTSVGEGMARGLPVVASDFGFNREMVGNCGLFYDVKNPSSFADAVKSYIIDPEMSEKKAKAGYDKIRERTLFTTAKEYYEFISSSL